MDITFLKTFLSVARTRHFGRTAQEQFITQSAVSSRVKQLEQQLGIRLLTRDRNNIQLTAAGIRFKPHAENIVAMWERARLETAVDDEENTLLMIGGLFSLWDHFLVNWFHQLLSTHKDLVYRLEALSQETLISRIFDGSVDLGFSHEPPQINGLNTRFVGNIEIALFSTETLSAYEAVAAQNYVYVDWGALFAKEHTKYFANTPTALMRSNHAGITLATVLKYGGSAFLDTLTVSNHVRANELQRLTDGPTINRPVYAIFSQQSLRLEEIRSIIDEHYFLTSPEAS